MVKENCGVVGIFSIKGDNTVPYVFDALRALQHRGQEAWGLAVPNKQPSKHMGLVSASSSKFASLSQQFSSNCVIGHVRYSTIGSSNLQNAQPLKVTDLCIAHNGTINNVEQLSNMVGGCSFTPQNSSDTMLVAQRLVSLVSKNGQFSKALSILKNEMVGSYCFVFLSDDGTIYAARDPYGFRPLVLGYNEQDDLYVIASESAALIAIGAKLIRDVKPGELLKINKDGMSSEMFSDNVKKSHCSFEFTYFAHPSSKMEGKNIYLSRKNIGRYLAKKFPIPDADLVIPVPDSARPAALGFAEELGVSFDEGLLKDRYSKKGPLRSFIQPDHSDRVDINRWIVPIVDIIRGKHIIVIDDSLVRGTSSKVIVTTLRNSGASKISLLITYPPIRFPCFAGIDFPSQKELATYSNDPTISNEKIIEMVRRDIGVDFLGYNDAENLARAIGIDTDSMCFTCHNGNYTDLGIEPKFKDGIVTNVQNMNA